MLADPLDVAAHTAEFLLEQKLKERKPVPESTGYCLNCNDPLSLGKKFCNAGCRDDLELAHKAKERNGK
jgi:hypothetical protein